MAVYYVQGAAASDNQGGTDADDSLKRSGSDGVSNSDTSFVSATAAFVAGDVGRGIWINTTTPRWRIIASVTNATTVVLNSALTSSQSGLSFTIGGSWKTIAKPLSATGFVSGDTCWVAPGTYRELVTVNMTSAVAETFLNADPTNSKGFKNGSGVAIAPGEVVWTTYTTNDTTAPGVTPALTLNGRDFLTIQNFVFVGSGTNNQTTLSGTTTNCTNITIRECVFLTGGLHAANTYQHLAYTGLADAASNWLVDRCVFMGTGGGGAIIVTLPTSGTADYDSLFTVQNCLFLDCTKSVSVASSGALANKGGGVRMWNCTCIGSNGMTCAGTSLSTTIPCNVYNSIVTSFNAQVPLVAGASGQIIEDYNVLQVNAASPRTNVTAGTHSISDGSYALLLGLGLTSFSGRLQRAPFTPLVGSPLLNFGNQASGPTVDVLNRPRPAGSALGASAGVAAGIGYLERHDTGQKSAAVDADGGTGAAVQILGPGDHDIRVPVNAASTVISVKVKWDANHGDGSKPQAILLANGEIGVAAETKTAAGSAGGGFETLTFSAIVPTAKSWVTIRLVSRAAAATGLATFDTLTVA